MAERPEEGSSLISVSREPDNVAAASSAAPGARSRSRPLSSGRGRHGRQQQVVPPVPVYVAHADGLAVHRQTHDLRAPDRLGGGGHRGRRGRGAWRGGGEEPEAGEGEEEVEGAREAGGVGGVGRVGGLGGASKIAGEG